MRENYDPMTMIPQDDGEALQALVRSDDNITKNLQGVYRCRRGAGDDVLTAYRKTLEAHLEAAGYEL